jgi:hypothetical protein
MPYVRSCLCRGRHCITRQRCHLIRSAVSSLRAGISAVWNRTKHIARFHLSNHHQDIVPAGNGRAICYDVLLCRYTEIYLFFGVRASLLLFSQNHYFNSSLHDLIDILIFHVLLRKYGGFFFSSGFQLHFLPSSRLYIPSSCHSLPFNKRIDNKAILRVDCATIAERFRSICEAIVQR